MTTIKKSERQSINTNNTENSKNSIIIDKNYVLQKKIGYFIIFLGVGSFGSIYLATN